MNKRELHLNKGNNEKLRPRSATYQRLSLDDTFKVTGEKGQFRFKGAVIEDNVVLWIDAYGPINTGGYAALRSFRPERIVMPSAFNVNRQRRTREGE